MSSRIVVDEIYGKTANTSALTIDSGGYVELPNTAFLDIWRLTANESHLGSDSYGDITNWGRLNGSYLSTTVGWEKIGPGMSHGSGVFTFPSTGKYEVIMNGQFHTTAGAGAYIGVHIAVSDDSGSSFDRISARWGPSAASSNYCWAETRAWLDVTNVSTTRVKFQTETAVNATLAGYSSNYVYTWCSFQKLAGT